MSIDVTRLTEHGVKFTSYSGRLTCEQLLAHYRGLGDADAAMSRWVCYFGPSADLSEIDFAVFTELKRVLAAKLVEIYGDRPPAVTIVCDSRVNQPILSVWCSYAGSDTDHPADPGLFSCLKGACDFLGLSGEAREALAAAVSASVSGVAPASRVSVPA